MLCEVSKSVSAAALLTVKEIFSIEKRGLQSLEIHFKLGNDRKGWAKRKKRLGILNERVLSKPTRQTH